MTHPAGLSARGEPLDTRLLAVLRTAAVLAVPLALLALLPGVAGDVAGWAAVMVVVATPLGRVGWLGVSWARRRDLRFALAALCLLVVITLGTVIAALRGDIS